MKPRAFTLPETMVVIVVIGIVATVLLSVMRPGNIREDALKKAGMTTSLQIQFATKNILAKHSRNYTLKRMWDGSSEFSIESSGNITKTVNLFKKTLLKKSIAAPSATYTGTKLTDGTTTHNLKPSSFTCFTIKNGAYFGVLLHNSCTEEINYLYDPSTPTMRTKSNTCGALFFDVNGEKKPNVLGIDQYILALGTRGVK